MQTVLFRSTAQALPHSPDVDDLGVGESDAVAVLLARDHHLVAWGFPQARLGKQLQANRSCVTIGLYRE
jgi:hypothetical protein